MAGLHFLKRHIEDSESVQFFMDATGRFKEKKKKEKKKGSKLPAVQPLWLNFRPLPASRIARHTCIIPQNVCTCLCFINIYSKTVYTPLDWSK